jgi:hypothetical protein
LEGRGRIEFAGGHESFGPAEVWLVPAALGAYKLAPETSASVLHAYVPDLDGLAKHPVEGSYAAAESDWSRVVHR